MSFAEKFPDFPLALTFDDVLLQPAASDVVPSQVDLSTRLTRKIALATPILSAPMDTVTEAEMAVAMARAGGLGVIHRNMSPEDQIAAVRQVKDTPAKGNEDMGAATPTVDDKGRLRVAAALGTGETALEMVRKLMDVGVDVVVVDTAHGHSAGVVKQVERLRQLDADLQIIAGNIATGAAAKALIEAGADAVKIGIGPGSICTTRIVAGVGVPQLTAVMNCYEVCKAHDIPLIADGGIKSSGDMAKAIAAGASCVMVGSMLAGTDETPGEVFQLDGRTYKSYRGMGSVGAMSKGSAERYFQSDKKKGNNFVPEGVEGRVAYKGSAASVLYQLAGGLRASMGYTGHGTVESMRGNCQFVRITGAGLRESHVHNLTITKESPNYRPS